MTNSEVAEVLRRLPYKFRVYLLDAFWLRAYVPSCFLVGEALAIECADSMTESFAEYLDDLIATTNLPS